MGLSTIKPLKNLNFKNPRWRTAASLKTVKSPYPRNRSTDFDGIWHVYAHCPLQGRDRENFEFLKIQKAAVAILKITEITISQQEIDRSSQN